MHFFVFVLKRLTSQKKKRHKKDKNSIFGLSFMGFSPDKKSAKYFKNSRFAHLNTLIAKKVA